KEIFNGEGASARLRSSIIRGGCFDIADADCDASVSTANPLLGPFADNGGFGATFLPGDGSPAIDAAAAAECPAFDQRGVPRPQGAGCDIGAVEIAVAPPRTCHVDADAGGAGSGASWSDAYVDLQSALHDPSCIEIWVAG